MLGGQVLIGFNYESFFETEFRHLTGFSQSLLTISLALLLVGLGLLLLPMPYHKIVEGGKISDRFHQLVTVGAHWALFAFGFALAADMYVAGDAAAGARFAALAAILSLIAALLAWYGLELGVRRRASNSGAAMTKQRDKTPL